ncbi:translocation/assembly module TamB domain-containing protein [Leeuwenhoekiella sp. MAR_2009_132]|uniref:translocation/assembly module TamB domain-containing protein n=1 Tax=Leeuwenhoekiella sp. MAR_2009_132 TaxID=1392489 RepID=UPI000569AF97|nr:translocation/assembly module TamB domain-containing protein [Leeuwenhoekiella sp. MAR_2009_132]
MKKTPKQKFLKVLKILGKIVGVIFILLLLLILFVRSPWGQGIIVDKAINYIEGKTQTEVQISKLFITFDGDIALDGLYLEDKKGDTLVYSKHLEAAVPLWSIITGGAISIDDVDWEGVKANVIRKDSITGFNYQFLIDAFAASDTTVVTTTPQDTTALQLNLGDFSFKDFDLHFKDDVAGMDAKLNLSELELNMKKTDLEAMRFEVGNVYLANTKVYYKQTKPLQPSTDTAAVPMPFLKVKNLKMKQVTVDYQSIPDGISAFALIGDFETEIPLVDLKTSKAIVDRVLLNNSEIKVAMQTVVKEGILETNEPSPAFTWPSFLVNIGAISLNNNTVAYTLDGAKASKGLFNPNALFVDNLTLNLKDILLENQQFSAELANASFVEASGLELKKLNLNLKVTDESLDVNNLVFSLNDNYLEGNAKVAYPSLAAFIENPGDAKMNLNVPQVIADLGTVFKFQPQLKNNEYLAKLSQRLLTGSLAVEGKLDDLTISPTRFNWGRSTYLSLQGTVYNATNPDNLSYNFPTYRIQSTRTDLSRFLNEKDLGVQFPELVRMSGSLKGTTTRALTKTTLETTDGTVVLNGNAAFGNRINFEGVVTATEIRLGKLLQNEMLGVLDLNLIAKGSGATINDLDAEVNATIKRLDFNEYTFKDLKLDGSFNNGKGNLVSAYRDDNLNMKLDADITLDSVASSANVNLVLIGADLQALGLVKQNIKAAFNLTGYFKGTPEDYEVNTDIKRGVAVYDDQAYQLGDLKINAFVKPDTTSLDIRNRILQLDLESNASPQDFIAALQRHVQTYLTEDPQLDTIVKPVLMKIRGSVVQAPILSEVFVPNLRELDTVNIAVDFDEYKRALTADVNLPYINYSGYTIDSLAFKLISNKDNMDFGFGLKELIAGPVNIKDTRIGGRVTNNMMYLDFLSLDKGEKLMHVLSVITQEENSIKIHIDDKDLILNRNKWKVNPNNSIVFKEFNTVFEDFKLSYQDQIVEVSNDLPGITKEHLGVNFQNFKLSSILNLLNPDESLVKGILNGDFVVEDPFTSPGMLADLNITNFEVLQTNMGILDISGKSKGSGGYDFDLSLKEGVADLDLTGDYIDNPEAAQIDLNLDIKRIDVKALENFSQGEITNASGSVNGNIKVTGSTLAPEYEGTLNFNKANFEIAKLNAPFLLANEAVRLDNKGIYFDGFKIQDASSNAITVSGNVGTESFINPTFDLKLKAKNFKALNSTKEDFDLVYGTVVFDADATVTGDLDLPDVDLSLNVNAATDVTYVLPPSEVQIESKDGVVIFVNKENPDAILTNSEEESYTVSGFAIDADLSIAKGALFKLIIDEQTGDNFQVTGTGDFKYNMYPNGRMTLSGRYNVNDGHYEMSLYNLVKRRFNLAPESRITWSGDPFDANLNIKASYEVETSASGLMASSTSGTDISTQSQFRQEVPFLVYINIDGELMKPIISFNLDIPEASRGAVGGQVYSQVQQLNQQENELNKQVFSLLVLNRFFPSSSSDGSGGGTATIARDNLNDAISDQLNVFSDKLLGNTGFDLNFGLDSYTDYQGSAPTDRTTLDIAAQKKLFDDRVVVSVGSAVDLQGSGNSENGTAPVVGNVSIEYLLTEDGRYRMRGYRRSQYENIIDGQIIVNGISLLFTREFNKFTELWQSMFPAKTEEEEINE